MNPNLNEKTHPMLSVSIGQPPPPPSVADGTSVVTNRIITVKKAKNINLRVETVSDRDDRPSENNVGQLPQAHYTARDGSVICNDDIHADEVDGDLDLSVCVKKS